MIGSDLWEEPFRPSDAILAAVLARKSDGREPLLARRQWIVAHAHAKILYLDSAVSLRVDNVIGSNLSVDHIIVVQGLESFRHLVQGVLAEVLRVGLDVIDGDISRDEVLQDASLLNFLKDAVDLVVPMVNVNAVNQLVAGKVSQHFCIVDCLVLLFLFSVPFK